MLRRASARRCNDRTTLVGGKCAVAHLSLALSTRWINGSSYGVRSRTWDLLTKGHAPEAHLQLHHLHLHLQRCKDRSELKFHGPALPRVMRQPLVRSFGKVTYLPPDRTIDGFQRDPWEGKLLLVLPCQLFPQPLAVLLIPHLVATDAG